jgi:hypothetical protein
MQELFRLSLDYLGDRLITFRRFHHQGFFFQRWSTMEGELGGQAADMERGYGHKAI